MRNVKIMISGYLKTDQTECYDDAGNIISCAGTGQDAAYRAGIVWPNTRFAWTLYTDDGNLGVGYKSNSEFFVWCVRDGILS